MTGIGVMVYKILRNAAKCKICDDVIESHYTHDYVTCKCGAISVDGGHDYLKRSGDPHNMINMCNVEGEEDA